MSAFDVAHDLRSLRTFCAAIDAHLELDAALLARVEPTVSGWSSEHHLAHVALANELVLRNLKSLAKGSGMLVVQGGEAHPRALELLAAGMLPRGEAQAPRMVRPPANVERALLLQWLSDGKRELDSLDPASLVKNGLKVPHQLLGPLDATEWTRFGAVHARHHLVIVGEILAALGARAPVELPMLAPVAR